MTKPILIYPQTVDWDYLHQRPQQLIKAASRNGAVGVFCNPNANGKHMSGIEKLTDTLFLANNMHLPNAIEWARRAFPGYPVVVLFSYPDHVSGVRNSKADLIVFDTLDEPEGEFAHWKTRYDESVKSAHLVTASATSLKERAQKNRTDEVLLIQNACDYPHFETAQTKHQLSERPFTSGKKVAGFYGAIATWLDWELIRNTVVQLPMIEFVFIGPYYGINRAPFTYTNAHFLGMRDYEELPKYLSNFDIAMIPFQINAMTKGVSPIKMWEYLAAGIPVISTALPEAIRTNGAVKIGNNHTFAELVKKWVDWREIETREKLDGYAFRIHTAQKNSWDARAKQLVEAINKKLGRPADGPKLYRKKALLEVIESRPDGYLVQNHGDPSDRWIIPRKTFEDTYEEV